MEVGSVAAAIELKDIDPFIDVAALAYYTAVPIQRMWKVPTTYGTTSLDIGAVKSAFWQGVADVGPPVVIAEADRYYFLGVMRSDFLLAGEEFRDNMGLGISLTLAGMDGRNPSDFVGSPIVGGFPVSVMPDVLRATNRDFYVADEHYEFDEIADLLRITTPGEGTITVGLGFGYRGDSADKSLSPVAGISWNHMDLFAKMVALEFMKDFVASRSLVNIDAADFDLNMDNVEARMNTLQEVVNEELPHISTAFMMLA